MKSEKFIKFIENIIASREEIYLNETGDNYDVFTWNENLNAYERSHHTRHWSSYATKCSACGSWSCYGDNACDGNFKRYSPAEMRVELLNPLRWELESLLPEGNTVYYVVKKINTVTPIIGYAIFTANITEFIQKFGGEEKIFYRDLNGAETYIIIEEDRPDSIRGVFLEK